MVVTLGFLSLSHLDYDGEVAATHLHCATLSSGNFIAQQVAINNLLTSVDLMTLGTLRAYRFGNDNRVSVTRPGVQAAQRELKWLVSFHDSTLFTRHSIELPCPDTSLLDPNDRNHAHIGDGGTVDTFITRFQALVKSPAGNAVLVDEITLVGRRV